MVVNSLFAVFSVLVNKFFKLVEILGKNIRKNCAWLGQSSKFVWFTTNSRIYIWKIFLNWFKYLWPIFIWIFNYIFYLTINNLEINNIYYQIKQLNKSMAIKNLACNIIYMKFEAAINILLIYFRNVLSKSSL